MMASGQWTVTFAFYGARMTDAVSASPFTTEFQIKHGRTGPPGYSPMLILKKLETHVSVVVGLSCASLRKINI